MKNSGTTKHTQAREHSSFLPSPYELLTSHFYSFLLIWQIRKMEAWLQFKSGHGMLCFFPSEFFPPSFSAGFHINPRWWCYTPVVSGVSQEYGSLKNEVIVLHRCQQIPFADESQQCFSASVALSARTIALKLIQSDSLTVCYKYEKCVPSFWLLSFLCHT